MSAVLYHWSAGLTFKRSNWRRGDGRKRHNDYNQESFSLAICATAHKLLELAAEEAEARAGSSRLSPGPPGVAVPAPTPRLEAEEAAAAPPARRSHGPAGPERPDGRCSSTTGSRIGKGQRRIFAHKAAT